MKLSTSLVVALTLLLAACSFSDDPSKERAKRAASAEGDIVIGAVWPWSGAKGSLWQGIELAVEEVNARGGVLKRKLRIVKEDDESSLAKGRLIAQQFAENPDMVAVIGHLNSYIALPASTIYQSAGLLYLTPGAHSYQINDQGYGLVFRALPSNRSVGIQVAEFMAAKGYRRVAIYYVKDKSSQDMANYFEQRARELGVTIVDRRSYTQGMRDFGNNIQNWKNLYQFDAMFLAANMPEGTNFIAQARKMGLSMPIVSGGGLDSIKLMEVAGAAAEGIFVPEVVLPNETLADYRHFMEIFARKYHRPAHSQEALGYDAVHLLVRAMREANSSVPEKIAQTLHGAKKWPGASGEFSFDDKGDIPDKKIGMKVVRGGKFEIVQ